MEKDGGLAADMVSGVAERDSGDEEVVNMKEEGFNKKG